MTVKDALLSWPRASLSAIFAAWKITLIGVVLGSPGLGYDTSSALLLQDSWSVPFVRWDSVYYTQCARRDYLFEQDWAFGWGFTRLIKLVVLYSPSAFGIKGEAVEGWVGICISHVGHYLAIHALYSLSLKLLRQIKGSSEIAFAAACLHIVSPAGIFLSAPCAEALFAGLQFWGYDAYTSAWSAGRSSSATRYLQLLFAGVCFGVAVTIRSNGLLSGILFAYDAAQLGLRVITSHNDWHTCILLVVTILAGSCIAFGAVLPQFIAYREYCLHTADGLTPRSWCSNRVPSIYAFVQVHYWNNGFLRYWTFSNLPLFLLATPVLWAMAQSSFWGLTTSLEQSTKQSGKARPTDSEKKHIKKPVKEPTSILRLLVIPQAILMVATLLNSHVQIITRIASGYPVWYLWLACAGTGHMGEQWGRIAWFFTRGMIMYALIQGVLYASFLPPA